MPCPHHHRGPPPGPGGARALPASPPHLSVQRRPLHHLLWERSLLQFQHKWKTAGTDGGQWLLTGKSLKLTAPSPQVNTGSTMLFPGVWSSGVFQPVSTFFLFSPQAILLSSDGQNLVTGGDNGVVEVWQACDFKQLYIYPGCDAGIRAMDLSHDQR